MEAFQLDGTHGINEMGSGHLIHLAADGAYLMAMVVVMETGLIFGALLEIMPDNDSQLEEQVDGIIEGRTAHPEVVLLHPRSQFLQGKMPIHLIYSLKNGKPLRCLPEMVFLQIIGQCLFYLD